MNQKQKLLESRGIGKLFHDKALADYEANEVIEWVQDKNHFAVGKGGNFFSTKADGYDIAILATRALVLTKVIPNLSVLHFSHACNNDTINEMWEVKCPVLITMFNPDPKYISGEKYLRLENILSYYLDHGIPFLLHFPHQLEDIGSLISPVFLDRIIKINKNFNL